MSIIEFGKSDTLRAILVRPGYYLVEIKRVSEKTSKAGDSLNYIIDEAEILQDENGDTQFAGVPTPFWLFNSKGKAYMVPFFEAIQGGEKIEAGNRISWGSQLEGKKLFVFIDNEKNEESKRLQNVIRPDYKAYKA